ncbi:MAG TPA: serpin family protein [Candidatus Limnocylindrales bacterium]
MLVGLTGACTSTASPTPSVATDPVAGPTASAARPTSSPIPSTGQAPEQGEIGPDALVVTVSDRLRVRSEPRVSADSVKYEPVLPLGTELLVLEGPERGSGYTWFKVSPVSFAGLQGPGYGWVAMADKDGEPWIDLVPGTGATPGVAMADLPRSTPDPRAAAGAAASINAFGIDMHRRLVTDKALKLGDKNMVFSPTSIALALAMARGGAKGVTAGEMDRVLHAAGWAELAEGLNALEQALAARNGTWKDSEGTKELILRTANAAFAQQGWEIERDYLDAIAQAFGAGVRLVDYIGDVGLARQTINRWVSDRTARRIPELLTPTDLSADTRLTLVNAVYLKAQWTEWFSEASTKPRPFTRLDGSRVSVPTMRRSGGWELPYARGKGWQATELRYLGPDEGHQLAMLLVLPGDLASFEAGLTAAKLERITKAVMEQSAIQGRGVDCPGVPADQQDGGCYPYNLDLFLPRFGIETRAAVNPVLEALGMNSAFGLAADFSGINRTGPLFISAVIHQANIDVDEKGTEAAAATAIGMDTGGGPSAIEDISLRLDHPFLFFVRDVETGAVLFMGRVVDPSAPKGR